MSVSRVPGGWVVGLEAEAPPADAEVWSDAEVWWVPDDGEPTMVGLLSLSVISPDGSLLVGTFGAEVVAVALPSLEERGRVTYEVGNAPRAVGVHGDLVLLGGVGGAPGATQPAVWDLSDGTLTVADNPAWVWGMSRDGRVLRRVDRLGADGPKDVVDACVDVVPLSRSLPVGLTGLCGEEAWMMSGGTISPDGAWIQLRSWYPERPGVFLLSVAELPQLSGTDADAVARRAEIFRPDNPPAMAASLWDTDGTFVTRAEDDWYRCDLAGGCVRLALPTGAAEWPAEAWVIPTYGP